MEGNSFSGAICLAKIGTGGMQRSYQYRKELSKKEKTEKKLEYWAKEHQKILIAGHTHRPVFPKPGEGFYFNDGSCVHPRCITAIELEGGELSLVKWSMEVRKDNLIYIGRQVLEGPVSMKEYQ